MVTNIPELSNNIWCPLQQFLKSRFSCSLKKTHSELMRIIKRLKYHELEKTHLSHLIKMQVKLLTVSILTKVLVGFKNGCNKSVFNNSKVRTKFREST